MDILQPILPLIGVTLGALLAGIGTYFRTRAERKRVIALALSDLLEARHHAIAIDVVLKEVRKRFTLPTQALPVVRKLVDTLTPIDANVHKRYDNAVSILAGIDPLLAFSMRSKTALPNFFGPLHELVASADISLADIEILEDTLWAEIAPSLDAAVLELAQQHSYLTVRKVRKLISKANEIPPELTHFFDQAASLAEKAESQVGLDGANKH